MTRKDYKLIAKKLNTLRSGLDALGEEAGTSRIVFSGFLSQLCNDLKQDNPNFNSAKFRDAVYEEVK